MNINLEMVQEDKNLYNNYMKNAIAQRSILIKQMSELEVKKELVIDEEEIERIYYEITNIVHEINSLTLLFEISKLNLEISELQEQRLKNFITEEQYRDGVAEIEKQKEQLEYSKENMELEKEQAIISSNELEQGEVSDPRYELDRTNDEKEELEKKQTESFKERLNFEITAQMHEEIIKRYKQVEVKFTKEKEEPYKESGIEFDSMA